MTVRVYRSTDPGAPNSLTGQIGSLIPILDACLVNGYGAGPDLKVGAGWTKEYSATNKAAYRGGTGNRLFFRIDDANPFGGNNNNIAGVRGYEAMTGIDTATGPFPLVSTHPNGNRWQKHNTNNNATPRPWLVVADERTCWFLDNAGGFESNSVHVGDLFGFGELLSDKSGDPWASFIAAGSSAITDIFFWQMLQNSLENVVASSVSRAIVCRDHLGTAATPHNFACFARGWDSANPGNSSSIPYPDPVSGGLRWENKVPVTCAGVIRGRLPGIGYPLHNVPLAPGDTFTADGKTWLVIHPTRVTGGANNSQVFIDITGPWE